jgi:hypothetical protein
MGFSLNYDQSSEHDLAHPLTPVPSSHSQENNTKRPCSVELAPSHNNRIECPSQHVLTKEKQWINNQKK